MEYYYIYEHEQFMSIQTKYEPYEFFVATNSRNAYKRINSMRFVNCQSIYGTTHNCVPCS